MVKRETECQPEGYTDGEHGEGGSNHQSQNVGARSAERHSYSHFLCALRDGKRNDAVESGGGECQRQQREQSEQRRNKPALAPSLCFQPPRKRVLAADGEFG